MGYSGIIDLDRTNDIWFSLWESTYA
jgi:hypothetical protein